MVRRVISNFARWFALGTIVTLGLSALSSCGDSDPTTLYPPVDRTSGAPGKRLAISVGPQSPQGNGMGLARGETHALRSEPREAVLAILGGKFDPNADEPFSVELAKSVEADIHQDLDPQANGPQQWLSRAKVVDDAGNVLWSKRILSLYDLLNYLKIVLDESTTRDFTLPQVVLFAKTQYPSLLEFPVRVPVGLEGASEYVLDVRKPGGSFYEAGRFSIDRLLRERRPPSVDGEIEPLEIHGPAEDRVDVAILGDGYRPSERSEFMGDAQAVVDRFETTKPFDRRFEAMNFRAVWTPSAESGAGYDCTGPNDTDCKRDFRDTVFRYTFAVSALADQFNLEFPPASARIAFPLEMAEVFEAAALARYDEVVLLSNSDRRSGFGGTRAAVLTAFDDRQNFPDVAIHELGHTFGVLGDEYYIRTDPCLFQPNGAPLPPNISRTAVRDDLKWNRWVEESTPLPTPTTPAFRDDIGAFKRARNCQFLYRPALNCKMRDSTGHSFCSVCTEQIIRRFYSDVDPVRLGYPRVTRTPIGSLRFESGIRDPALHDVEWTLDGERIGSDPSLTLDPSEVGASWKELRMTVEEASGRVRASDPRLRSIQSWAVRAR